MRILKPGEEIEDNEITIDEVMVRLVGEKGEEGNIQVVGDMITITERKPIS